MTFTIDNENSISAFATAEEAAAATQTPFDSFASEKELAELIAAWPPERLVATWNSLPGVVALKSLPDTKAAKDRWAKRIWARIQDLGEAAQPETEATQPETAPAKPKAGKKATGRAQSAKGAPAKAKATKKATAPKKAPKAKTAPTATKTAKAKEAAGPREGSKMAEVIAMMQRKGGATISEIMKAMSWQRHTVRGFVAGALKKAGYAVESFKPEGGERSYRLPK